MSELFEIGKVYKEGTKLQVRLETRYQKGMKHMDSFSHIHLIVVTGTSRLTLITGKICRYDLSEGGCVLDITGKEIRVKDKEFPLSLVDIKPYMPGEDYVKNMDHTQNAADGEQGFGISVRKGKTEGSYEFGYAGEIRNTHGVTWLQYNEEIKMPAKTETFVRVFWWFDKFEETVYRRILQCDPPYECEGKTGVFACRAPIRPNPVAMTCVRVERVDRDNHRIYISKIESFDHTPFLGVMDYDADFDRVSKEEVKLPEWTKDWPDEILIEGTKDRKDVEELIEELDAGVENVSLGMKGDILEESTNDRKGGDITADAIEGKIRKCRPHCRPARINVKGARENNLKGITTSIPYGKITAVVGVSGSGKSSLVVDTIYAECQRRMDYLRMENAVHPRPEMESMDGCVPAVMISQKEIRAGSNSTVGTFSGIQQHLRCIYAAIGKRHFEGKKSVTFLLTPATFSFMDPECRCQACNGKGKKWEPDLAKIITTPDKSLLEGASPVLGKLKTYIAQPNANWMKGQVVALSEDMGVDLALPWENLPEDFKKKVLYGDETREVSFVYDNRKNGRKGEIRRTVEGIFSYISRLSMDNDKGGISQKYMAEQLCDVCRGERLAKEGRLVTVLGVRFPVAAALSFHGIHQFALKMKQELSEKERQLVEEHIDAILAHCESAKRLGIEYLELGRTPSTLSGGEAQRLKLLSAFQNHMSGILYIFDEPSKKLSPKEYSYILDMMQELIAEGNTILMVEHNMDMIRIADYVIEIGPQAGNKGGYLVAEGNFGDVIAHPGSMLGKYAITADRYEKDGRENFDLKTAEYFEVKHVNANNVKDVSVRVPKKALTCITGVSGSGKSTLLYKGILPQMEKGKIFDQVILVESKISGSSSRSVLATYVGMMDDIRKLFAGTDAAQKEGFVEKDFSFNTGSLRCGHCGGDGRVKIPYTEDAYGTCPICHGSRYSKNAENILWHGKNISGVLALPVEEAVSFFEGEEHLVEKCRFLIRVGLSYLNLGQSTGSLSGGEAARLKIAACLMNASMKNSLFLFDEPTCGLHFSDIDHLIGLIYELVDAGNTVVAIEHNKRFLSAADDILTMGPGAGEKGGRVLKKER